MADCGRQMRLPEQKCANCVIFGWKQVDPTIPLKRCTGCYKISYCSKECQVEHWHKVHRRHCKYLSGKKPLEESALHKKKTCGRCIKQKAAGRKVFKENEPMSASLTPSSTPATGQRSICVSETSILCPQ